MGDDGVFETTLWSEGRSCDLSTALAAWRDVDWAKRRETPLDALLQSGRFEEIFPSILAQATERRGNVSSGRAVTPVVRPSKILALGRTYREHALELGNAPLPEPLVFDKLADTLVPTGTAVANSGPEGGRLDHEAELALIVGRRASALPNGNGRNAIAAVTIANDLTLRTAQKAAQKAGHPWLRAKSFPGACVLGPWAVAVSPSVDLDRLEITCTVNGEVRQRASTSGLVQPVGALVEWLSQWIPLNPGDVILTGTPAGTGPLLPGDVCEITIIGENLDLGRLVTNAR
jgi:2-keto-4-pentenoate hydratase/2-oxohepta-3-ene-1,7-dioic acid hydratase in catechol pathway